MQKFYLLFQVLDKWKANYLLAGILLAGASLVRMLEPKILQIAVDVINPSATADAHQNDGVVTFFYSLLPTSNTVSLTYLLLAIAGLFIFISTIKAIGWFVADVMVANSTEKAIKQFRDNLFAHIQTLSLTQMSQIPTGEMIQRCTGDIGTVQKFIGTQISELIRLASIALGAFAMMWIVHPTYALISISLFLPIVLTSYFFFIREQKVWDEHENEQDKLTAIIQENLSGIRVVQAFAQEESEMARFAQQNLAKRAIGVRHIDLHMLFWPFSDWLVNIQIALSACAGAYYSIIGAISLGEFASFFTYSLMVTWPMRNLGRVVSQLGMAGVAMERIQQILNGTTENYEGEDYHQEKIKTISFRKVSFAYPSDNKNASPKYALQDVSFEIEAGESVAIMGSTGAGKSTIIALLLRFYEPTSGEILLNNRPIQTFSKRFLRQEMGVVLQKPFLFSTSIRANIAYATHSVEGDLQLATNKEIEETALLSAAQDAAVADFIDKIPNGYDTLVGEKGVALSGGQKQRVALARTLLRNPSILVLDDATSAVDTETEFRIQQALQLRLKGSSNIIISHRLTSVQHADKIIVLESGKVVETGTHQQLLKNKGFYKSIYDIQILAH